MPAERVAMRKVRDILRLKLGVGLSHKAIARSLGIAPSTVRLTLERTGAAGFSWPLPDDATDTILEEKLYGRAGTKQGYRHRAEPDWAVIHRELKKKHVTLAILWEEYIAQNPGGYRYSRFCDLYRSWEGRLSVTMRQSHAGGEKLFVDYAGDTVPVIVDRLSPPVAALEAMGGVPKLLVPDNAKVAVIKACHFDPVVNRSYAEMAAHYDMAVLPARPRKPKDKAKVEAAVLIVERWLLGRLRHRTFYSLAELNQAIAELLHHLNDVRSIRRLGVTRRQLLEELGRPLPPPPPPRVLVLPQRAGAPGRHRLPCRYRPPLLLRALSLRPPAGR